MMIYKVNDKDIPFDIDQYNNYLLLVDDPDLYKLIYQY